MELVDITKLIIALITFVCAVITTFAVPWMKARTSAEQWTNILAWANAGVKAAEIIIKGNKMGDERREFVMGWIKQEAAKHGMKVDLVTARVAIENAWDEVINSAKERKDKEQPQEETNDSEDDDPDG